MAKLIARIVTSVASAVRPAPKPIRQQPYVTINNDRLPAFFTPNGQCMHPLHSCDWGRLNSFCGFQFRAFYFDAPNQDDTRLGRTIVAVIEDNQFKLGADGRSAAIAVFRFSDGRWELCEDVAAEYDPMDFRVSFAIGAWTYSIYSLHIGQRKALLPRRLWVDFGSDDNLEHEVSIRVWMGDAPVQSHD